MRDLICVGCAIATSLHSLPPARVVGFDARDGLAFRKRVVSSVADARPRVANGSSDCDRQQGVLTDQPFNFAQNIICLAANLTGRCTHLIRRVSNCITGPLRGTTCIAHCVRPLNMPINNGLPKDIVLRDGRPEQRKPVRGSTLSGAGRSALGCAPVHGACLYELGGSSCHREENPRGADHARQAHLR
jgi:hypothetical protein